MKFPWKLCAVSTIVQVANAASTDEWRSRSIYQLLTDRFARPDGNVTIPCITDDRKYCGGTWRGVVDQLDYIQGMGFSAIWISPITYNIPGRTAYGDAFHGYWQQDLYRLNDHFGEVEDLKVLSKALHDRDMYLMVDIVVNHNGWSGPISSVDYSDFHPFNNASYYHNPCSVNYANQTSIEDCWLGDDQVPLVDLRTEDQVVLNEYSIWIKELVSNYSIDGLRIDTVKHVGKPFWSSFTSAAGVFSTGEIFAQEADYVCDYQNHMPSVLNYPAYYAFNSFLSSTSGNTGQLLYDISTLKSTCKDVSVLGTFSENHDVPRFASQTQDLALAKNIIALTLLWDGIPIIYAGQEQHYAGRNDPYNREATWLSSFNRTSELYQLTAKVNQVRQQTIARGANYTSYNIYALWNNTNTVALRKGLDGNQIISVFTNHGTSAPADTISIQATGWSAGTSVLEVLSCKLSVVGQDGGLQVNLMGGEPKIFVGVGLSSAASGICSP